MANDTTTTIDSAGRVVIPKDLREKAGLHSGARIRIRLRSGLIEIEPDPREIAIVRRGRLHIAVPVDESEPLTTEVVEGVRAKIRSSRGEHR